MQTGRGAVAEIAASQWGLVTTAQAEAHGVSRMLLSRMAASRELERVMHGVYVATSHSGGPEVDVRARWIALDPGTLAPERLALPHEAGVVSHTSAAAMHRIGDIPVGEVELTVPERHRTRRPGTLFHRASLDPSDVTLIDGLPVTTPARTVADLLVDGHDMAHVADAVADILARNLDTTARLAVALDPIADQFDADSGSTLLHELLAITGMDPATVLERLREHDLVPRAWTTTDAQRDAVWHAIQTLDPSLVEQMEKVAAALAAKSLPDSPSVREVREALLSGAVAGVLARATSETVGVSEGVDLSRLLDTYAAVGTALPAVVGPRTSDGWGKASDAGDVG